MSTSGVQLKVVNPLVQEQLPVEQWGINVVFTFLPPEATE